MPLIVKRRTVHKCFFPVPHPILRLSQQCLPRHSLQMTNSFASARLIYRAAEPSESALFEAIQADPIAYRNANVRYAVPQSKANAAEYMKYVTEEALLGVVVCLKPSNDDAGTATTASFVDSAATTSAKPLQPIGVLTLGAIKPPMHHHRHSEIGIDFLAPFHGKGYGSEAIQWVLRWAFMTLGLHRVQVRAFEYNDGARRLYERLGFKPEGRWRESLWFEGRWWDEFQYAILDREWHEMQKQDSEE